MEGRLKHSAPRESFKRVERGRGNSSTSQNRFSAVSCVCSATSTSRGNRQHIHPTTTTTKQPHHLQWKKARVSLRGGGDAAGHPARWTGEEEEERRRRRETSRQEKEKRKAKQVKSTEEETGLAFHGWTLLAMAVYLLLAAV